jgi:signal transduction histidine kinase
VSEAAVSRFKLNLKIRQQGAILVAVPLIFELVLVGWLAFALFQAKAQMDSESQSRAVVQEASGLGRAVLDAGTILFALRFTSNPKFINAFNDKLTEEEVHLKELVAITAGNKRQEQKVADLAAVSLELSDLLKKYGRPADDSADPHTYLIRSGSRLREMFTPVFMKLNNDVTELNNDEKTFQDSMHIKLQESWTRITVGLIGGVVFSIISGIGLAILFSRGILGRVYALKKNATRLVSRQELEKPVEGSDELAQLDRDLYEIASALRDAEQRKQEFTSMISHDLRTPLTSLKGTLQLMTQGLYGELNDVGKQRTQAANRNVQRLIALISDLLDVEKIEAGLLQLDLEDMRIADVINDAQEMVRDFAEQKKIDLLVQESADAWVRADRKRLGQVVQNLIGNAIKFSPNESKIRIKVRAEKPWVKVSIADSGPGIKKEEIGEMFQRFKQTEHGKRQLGTGLGLAICKAIVVQHGGEIGVESEEGAGSTFWFRLKMIAARTDRSADSASQPAQIQT